MIGRSGSVYGMVSDIDKPVMVPVGCIHISLDGVDGNSGYIYSKSSAQHGEHSDQAPSPAYDTTLLHS